LFERRRSEFGRFQPTERKFFERSGRSLELYPINRIVPFAYFLFQDNWSEAEIADTKINKHSGGKT
ncbi:MAG: hypothetical protein WCG08_12635, partial [Paludibacter sp.]